MQLFAKNGFRGTTTRDLAALAGVNEAIIFRHFSTKEELYSAILEHKVCENRDARSEEIDQLATGTDDERFFQTVGRTFLERHARDSTFMRLLLFSALEGHQLSQMFVANIAARSPNPIANYIQRRINEGAFRPVNAELAARALVGMFASFVLWQEVFGQKEARAYDRDEVVRTFVSIFLSGISKE